MSKKRNLYLNTISVDEAREKYLKAVSGLLTMPAETIPVTESLGRVTMAAYKTNRRGYRCGRNDIARQP